MSDYWIQTFTGRKFDLLEPTEDMICIEDIAHHLSQINRFCGAAKFPYSVGYHSILACQKMPKGLELEGLLHEIDEPYIQDISYPLKRVLSINTNTIKEISYIIKILGIKKFHLCADVYTRDSILEVDCRLAITEEQQLMKNSGYLHGKKYENLKGYEDIEILKLSAENVEELFLKEYEKWRRI